MPGQITENALQRRSSSFTHLGQLAVSAQLQALPATLRTCSSRPGGAPRHPTASPNPPTHQPSLVAAAAPYHLPQLPHPLCPSLAAAAALTTCPARWRRMAPPLTRPPGLFTAPSTPRGCAAPGRVGGAGAPLLLVGRQQAQQRLIMGRSRRTVGRRERMKVRRRSWGPERRRQQQQGRVAPSGAARRRRAAPVGKVAPQPAGARRQMVRLLPQQRPRRARRAACSAAQRAQQAQQRPGRAPSAPAGCCWGQGWMPRGRSSWPGWRPQRAAAWPAAGVIVSRTWCAAWWTAPPGGQGEGGKRLGAAMVGRGEWVAGADQGVTANCVVANCACGLNMLSTAAACRRPVCMQFGASGCLKRAGAAGLGAAADKRYTT